MISCYAAILTVIFILNTLSFGRANIDRNEFPPLYASDDYKECLEGSLQASYCIVYAELQPNNNSKAWLKIDNIHKSYQFHYRHDEIYRGVCTSKCKVHKDSPHLNRVELEPDSRNLQQIKKYHEISQNQHRKYEQHLHECVNNEMQERYNLTAKTLVTYCETPSEPMEKGNRYRYAIFVLIAIALLNILSSLYDAYLKSKQNANDSNAEYYDRNHKDQAQRRLTSFSLYRNYRRLMVANTTASGRDLSSIDGFRTLLSFTIVLEHVGFVCQAMYLKNPEVIEYIFSTTIGRMMMHMTVCIELFFLMSGLMLYMKFDKDQKITTATSLKQCFYVFIRMMCSRYLRYMPSVLFLVLFSSEFLIHLQKAPFWRHFQEPHTVQCRSLWWSNILMLTNVGMNKTCWPHTWYIATDFQLYGIFLAVLIIVAKYPQYKRRVYTIVGILGLTIPSIINYIKKADAINVLPLDLYRHMYIKDAEILEYTYLHPYTNLNGFFIGILCGEIYVKYLKNYKNKQIVARFLKPWPLVGWSIILATWYLGSKLLFREHSIWTSLFVILHRHVAVVIIAIVVIVLRICNGGGFLSSPIFRPLARISYQVYLWHLIILFIIMGRFQQPLDISFLFLGKMLIVVYAIVAVPSFFITIMVEYPFAELLSVFDLKSKSTNLKSH